MRQRIGIQGSEADTLEWVSRLSANPQLEIISDLDAALAADTLDVLVDLSGDAATRDDLPEGVQIVSRQTAELLWLDSPAELEPIEPVAVASEPTETSLRDVLEAHRVMSDPAALYGRILEVGLESTGASSGSLMLLDPTTRALTIAAARGVEHELWPKISVPLGHGIAGRAAALGEPQYVTGRVVQGEFDVIHERHDVGDAQSIPLIHDGTVHGVLNLHRAPDAQPFDEAERGAGRAVAQSHAEVVAQSRSHTEMSERASRFSAHREIRDVFKRRGSLIERLNTLCDSLAHRADGGIAALYLCEPGLSEMRLVATSLAGSGFGDYRVRYGEGLEGRAAKDHTPIFLPRPDGSIAYAALPLRSGDALVGVLALQLGSKPFENGSGVRETLLELGALLADEVASARAALLRDSFATRIAAVGESGLQCLAQTDPEEIARQATSAMGMILDADHAIVRLRDEAAHRFAIVSYFGSADGTLQEKLFEFDQRIAGDILARRTPLHRPRITDDPELSACQPPVRTLVAVPLYRGATPIGTLSAYDRLPTDEFTPSAFLAEDLEVTVKLARFVERALANVMGERETESPTGTKLLDRAAFEERLTSELVRGQERRAPLAVAILAVENLDAATTDDDPDGRARLVGHAARALQSRLRPFDSVARIAADQFAVLLPEAGRSPEERVTTLARGVAEAVKTNAETKRMGLAIGYAIYPEDGEEADALLEHAQRPRIRTV